jgi:hypothetical protein
MEVAATNAQTVSTRLQKTALHKRISMRILCSQRQSRDGKPIHPILWLVWFLLGTRKKYAFASRTVLKASPPGAKHYQNDDVSMLADSEALPVIRLGPGWCPTKGRSI